MERVRQKGYYWVKYEGEWMISNYHGSGKWELSRSDYEFDQIDEQQIVNPNNPVRGDEESAESFMDRLNEAGLTEKEHCCGACKDGHKCESDASR